MGNRGNGTVDVRRTSYLVNIDLVDEADRYSTVAGYILWRLSRLPEMGERAVGGRVEFEIVSRSDRNIEKGPGMKQCSAGNMSREKLGSLRNDEVMRRTSHGAWLLTKCRDLFSIISGLCGCLSSAKRIASTRRHA